MQFINICTKITQIALPQQCLLCGAAAGELSLCGDCHADLPWMSHDSCPVCAMPSLHKAVCGACLKRSPYFDRTVAALAYQFPLHALLHAYKYGEQLQLASLFGRLLAVGVGQVGAVDMLLPMPLHAERLRQRGFNQAAELAKVVGSYLHLPVALHVCSRVRATPPQTGLPHDEREKNLRGAFACAAAVKGMRIAIVDDVMTSGASLDELAGALKRAGAAEVHCWVLARTLANRPRL